jgi:hypothetical protein
LNGIRSSRLRGETAPVADIHTYPAAPRTLRFALSAHFQWVAREPLELVRE